nr:hypothetical protein [Tanacetum cinerariifolium]
ETKFSLGFKSVTVENSSSLKDRAEANSTTNTISFILSNFDKPLSFKLDEFSTVTDLKPSENFVSLPLKETMKADLETLRLIDENDTSISSSNLANSYPLKMRYFSSI